MNKFKKILLGTLSVLTLGLFVATGAKVNAATSTTNYTYDWYSHVFFNGATATTPILEKNKEGDFKLASEENDYSIMDMHIKNESGSTFRYVYNSNATKCGIEIQKKNNSTKETFTFTTKGDASITMNVTTGGTNKAQWYYKIDNNEEQSISIGTLEERTFDFTGAGEHTFVVREATASESEAEHSNFRFQSFTLVEKQVVEDSATIVGFQQEGKDGAYTYVRFVYIASGYTELSSAKLTNALTLVLDEGTENKKTVTRTPRVVTKITNNGSTYVGTPDDASYEFDNATNTDDVYIIYVVKFTTATYKTHTIKAVLNYGSSYASAATPYTFTE